MTGAEQSELGCPRERGPTVGVRGRSKHGRVTLAQVGGVQRVVLPRSARPTSACSGRADQRGLALTASCRRAADPQRYMA